MFIATGERVVLVYVGLTNCYYLDASSQYTCCSSVVYRDAVVCVCNRGHRFVVVILAISGCLFCQMQLLTTNAHRVGFAIHIYAYACSVYT